MGYVALDYTSLLLATGFSGLCLALMMVVSWLSARSESFMLTWAVGIMVLVAHVFSYGVYFHEPDPRLFPLMASLLVLGLSVLFGAAFHFCHGANPGRPGLIAAFASVGVVLLPLLWGLDGVALIMQNGAAATLLILSGLLYLRNRAQARPQMIALFALYAMSGISFGLCGVVLLSDGQWVIGHAPDNWAERLNIVVSVFCLSGASAISLALHHSRLARRHEIESMTDPLTGLLNRRALFERLADRQLGAFCAIAMFDIDHFKRVNDRFGHAAGDEVLAAFGRLLDRRERTDDLAVRLGGEEFALVMPRITPEHAIAAVERIRADFSSLSFVARGEAFSCTVSAGIGWGARDGNSLDSVLIEADRALYAAKGAGRDRIEVQAARRIA